MLPVYQAMLPVTPPCRGQPGAATSGPDRVGIGPLRSGLPRRCSGARGPHGPGTTDQTSASDVQLPMAGPSRRDRAVTGVDEHLWYRLCTLWDT